MPRIIGVDPSLTATGLVTLETTVPGQLTSADLQLVKSKPLGDQSWADRHDRIHTLARRIGLAFDGLPTVVVIESPAYSAGKQKSAAVHDRAWLWGAIFHEARRRGIPVLCATPQQRMKYATGSGVADKDVVLAAAIRRWPELEITNNNVADAMIFAAMGARAIGYPVDDVPVKNQETIAKMAG